MDMQCGTNDSAQEQNLQIRKEELLMKLLLNEFGELLTPIVFVLSIIVAYYGPNARIIGNVKNNYWPYEKIENISSYFSRVLYFTLIHLFLGFPS